MNFAGLRSVQRPRMVAFRIMEAIIGSMHASPSPETMPRRRALNLRACAMDRQGDVVDQARTVTGAVAMETR